MNMSKYFTPRTAFLTGILLLLAVFGAIFHTQIHRRLALYFLINSKDPREEAFFDLAAQYEDPVGLLNGCWGTGRVTHRALVAGFLKAAVNTNPTWLKAAIQVWLGTPWALCHNPANRF